MTTLYFTFTRYNRTDGIGRSSTPSETYRFVASDFDQVFQGETYTAEPIKITGLDLTGDKTDASIKLTVPKTNAIAQKFIDGGPAQPYWLKIQADTGSGVLVIFNGRIRGVVFEELTAELDLASIGEVLKRIGLRQQFSAQCPHSLFSAACGVNKAARTYNFFLLLTPQDIKDNGRRITFSETQLTGQGISFSDEALKNGYISINGSKYATVVRNASLAGTITLEFLTRPAGLETGQALAVELTEGCDKTAQTCSTKFNNINNFGGFHQVPRKDPFSEGLV